jgi:hypothetical protein
MTIIEMANYIAKQLPNDILMNAKFPYDSKTPANKRRYEKHMKETVIARTDQTIMVSPEIQYFELGNELAEEKTPHYHILEDAKIIRNPYKGTKKSKGSQRLVADKPKRDYGQFVITKTTGGYGVIQEYRQNMTRNYDGRIGAKTQPREYSKRKQVTDINKRNYRYNKHYQYIERILFDVTKGLAIETDTKLKVGQMSDMSEQPTGFLDKNFELDKITNISTIFGKIFGG